MKVVVKPRCSVMLPANLDVQGLAFLGQVQNPGKPHVGCDFELRSEAGS